ncbi:MAG: ABC transporter ATP-binding protein [Deltaproteobacteria bacterium]|nr:ABC transporter ATP-binding protein [Deltaproteobacteria bacterium]MBW1930438.1 ABC transporter ATP-binding protein [Deltaproteobacteria bacterium]MBW2025368.1 ABC transporter ATP-binding protein [Deltaproteobacteria bacterium]MBW2125111.1 ABC transporter ATP-binding protein [Deltaproteobacteria bacterium]RLB13935.1 MAG: ABC transporter ATP-binding protein [Deltaproteobacteria bacterium]
METEALLHVDKISKAFGGVNAVSEVSFTLKRGEVLGVIGPNGSGKTTLVNLITGFVRPDRGRVYFKGKEITGMPPHKIANLGLTRTFQVMRPYHSLPAFKNLIIPLNAPRVRKTRGGKLGDVDAVAIDILEEIGFERDARVPYKPAGSLPLGYLKRLELGRCIALRPEVIICDEILSGLSMSEITGLLPLLERLQMDGISLVMIEHRLRELFRLADRVIVLSFGQKIADGTPEEVMENQEVKKAYLGREKKR